MPLIGTIDTERAQQILEALLNGVTSSKAHVALIDITGVPVIDTQVIDILMHAAQACRLLGARVMLTGIRPEVAQTIVGLGIDLREIETCATLQLGIASAIGNAN